ncbi:hypothetical protein [Streptomyces sp. NA02950]|uniref:hypothetical protein n=1 Tax=Streptomyces sp. NA02950 TaxID=2742137 RepID=UPI0020CB4D4A|nr:hypothetical protein [Streptomyces sp. NA02950]
MDPHGPELKKELDATLQTREEQGAEYESEPVDSFMEKVGQRFDNAADRHQRRQTAERQMAAARGTRGYGIDARGPAGGLGMDGFGERFAFVGVSLVLAIPLSAIGAANEGLAGLLVTWAGIVGVNAVHAMGGFSRLRRGSRGDREAAASQPHNAGDEEGAGDAEEAGP